MTAAIIRGIMKNGSVPLKMSWREGHRGLYWYLRDAEDWKCFMGDEYLEDDVSFQGVFVLNAGTRGSGRGPTVPAPLSSLQPKERGDL